MTQASPLASPEPWNLVESGYSELLLPIFTLYSRDAVELAKLPPRARVLDVAAGPGTLSLLVAPQAAHVSALDFAPAMIERLRLRAAELGLTNVEARVGDGQALPYMDETFDAAFSMFGLMFFPDRVQGFRELHRVLRPGGRAVVSSWAPLDAVPVLAAMFEAVRAALPGLPFAPGKAPLGDPEDFRQEMESGGFRDVRVETVSHEVTAPSVDAFWELNVRSSAPIVLMRHRFEPAQWEDFSASVLARLRAQFGDGELRYRWVARLGVGTR